MPDRNPYTGRILAVAVTAALLLAAMPGSVAGAPSPTDCIVWGPDGEHASLQDAVSSAPDGTKLTLQGTCVGTSLIDKDLRVKGVRVGSSAMWCDRDGRCHSSRLDSGRPTISSDGTGPSLVIDPSVPRFITHRAVVVKGGVVVDDIGAWSRSGIPADTWAVYAAAPKLWAPARKPRACRVVNRSSGDRFASLRKAVRVAEPGDRLVMQGACKGPVLIDKELSLRGIRRGKTTRSDSGPPMIKGSGSFPALMVAPGVTGLVLKRIVIKDGLSVGDTAAYRRYLADH